MTFRVRHKIDANQPAIVKALRDAGYCVQHLNQGDGVPDLLVADPITNKMTLLEVKMPKAMLTKAERDWHYEWPIRIYIVTTPEEALIAVGANMRSQATESNYYIATPRESKT